MLGHTKRIILLILGIVSTILGLIGMFLPILPTTPFLILSAYLFSKSSKKLHNWLLEHKIFGPVISDWEKYGVINKRAKIISTIMIVLLFSYTLIFVEVSLLIKCIVASSGVGVLAFILSRPSNRV